VARIESSSVEIAEVKQRLSQCLQDNHVLVGTNAELASRIFSMSQEASVASATYEARVDKLNRELQEHKVGWWKIPSVSLARLPFV
jgi:regulator of replication initiation timing